MRTLFVLVVLALCIASCQNTIEGFPVGDMMCVGEHAVSDKAADYTCKAFSLAGWGALAAGHAPVISDETYEDVYGMNRIYGSGHAQGIVVLELGDGTKHSYFLGCVVGPFGDPASPVVSPDQCGPIEPMEGEHWSLPPGANEN